MTTLLICDDHKVLTDALATVVGLDDDLQLVAPPVHDPETAIALSAEHLPDVVLMDIVFKGGGMSGIEATRRIKEISPATKVVIITAHDEDRLLVEAVEAGASGFLGKGEAAEEVLAAAKAAAEGEVLIDPATLTRLLAQVAREREAQREATMLLDDLTDREREILQLLAEGMRNEGIATKLFISPQTVQTHVRNILGKLRVHSKLEAVALRGQARRDHGLTRPRGRENSCPAALKSRSPLDEIGTGERTAPPGARGRHPLDGLGDLPERRPESTPPGLGPFISLGASSRGARDDHDGQRARRRTFPVQVRGISVDEMELPGELEPSQLLGAVDAQLLERRRIVDPSRNHERADVRPPVGVGAARPPPRPAPWGGMRALARPPPARPSPRRCGSRGRTDRGPRARRRRRSPPGHPSCSHPSVVNAPPVAAGSSR